VFYKDISDIQINVPVDYNTVDELPQSVRDAFSPTGAGPFRVTQRINAGSASLWGAEFDYSQQLSFLPDPWSGLGVFFNASYISPDDEDILALTAEDGIAKHTFNTGFSFKKGRFDGRISANIVGERLRGVSGVSVSADGTVTPGTGTNSYRKEYLEARTQFDVNLNYELTRYATLFCNISNLTNVEQFRYNETEQNLTRWGFYGRRLTVGIKGSF
jgi:outer membrane receptor protein involved in Fe transport